MRFFLSSVRLFVWIFKTFFCGRKSGYGQNFIKFHWKFFKSVIWPFCTFAVPSPSLVFCLLLFHPPSTTHIRCLQIFLTFCYAFRLRVLDTDLNPKDYILHWKFVNGGFLLNANGKTRHSIFNHRKHFLFHGKNLPIQTKFNTERKSDRKKEVNIEPLCSRRSMQSKQQIFYDLSLSHRMLNFPIQHTPWLFPVFRWSPGWYENSRQFFN